MLANHFLRLELFCCFCCLKRQNTVKVIIKWRDYGYQGSCAMLLKSSGCCRDGTSGFKAVVVAVLVADSRLAGRFKAE